MNKFLYKQILGLIILVTFSLVVMVSCEKEPEAPDLAPVESLVMDLNQFPSGNNNEQVKSSPQFIFNWLYSYVTVFSWNTVIAVNIAIPVASYLEAFNHTPVYLGDNQWEWSYSTDILDKTYVSRLLGTRIDNETYTMEMYLSEGSSFSDFKWFEGVIRYDQTEVNWKISHSPSQPTQYLDVDYNRDFETDKVNIRYTIIDPENDLYQSYIEYGRDTALYHDSHYHISKADTLTLIQWNSTSKAGRVMDELHFGDNSWHCWDSQFKDVDCPLDLNNKLTNEYKFSL